ncbi:MAG: substrate-binding domain-containing protein, partial [Hungatella sp.]
TAADQAIKMAFGEKVDTKYTVDYVKVAAAGKAAAAGDAAAKAVAAIDPTTGGKDFTVGICIYKFDDNFMTLYREELQKYLETTYNAKVTIVDGKGDQAEQTNQIDNFITQGVDVLILNLVQASATETVANKCRDAKVPAVFINREPEEAEIKRWTDEKITASYVGADARQSGTFQGEIILETPNKGDINGDGTVLNDHIAQSHMAADVAAQMIAGKPIETKYTVDYVTVK